MEKKKTSKKKTVKKPTPQGNKRTKEVFGDEKSQVVKFTTNDNVLIAVGIGLVLLVGLFMFNMDAFSSLFGSGSVIAKVNNEAITQNELDSHYNRLPVDYREGLGVDETTLKKVILEQLVAKTLLLQDAEEKGISVEKSEVDEALEQLKLQAGLDDATYLQKLTEQGLTEKDMTQLIEEQLLVTKLAEKEILPNLQIDESILKQEFVKIKDQVVQVKASHILVCYTGTTRCSTTRTEEEALERVAEVLSKLDAGQNFNDLAREYSDDPSATTNLGDLGWFGRGQMVKAFEDSAFGLRVGLVSRGVKTDFGYHLIKVEEKKDSYEDFKEELTLQYASQQQDQALQAYITLLSETAEIEYTEVQEEETEPMSVDFSLGNNPGAASN
jgi:parvulin-like peptidyl-prolyl isomerase